MFDIEDPYVSYKINITVQQLDYQQNQYDENGLETEPKDVWKTVGYAEIGPQRVGQNTNQNQVGETSGPQVSVKDRLNIGLAL